MSKSVGQCQEINRLSTPSVTANSLKMGDYTEVEVRPVQKKATIGKTVSATLRWSAGRDVIQYLERGVSYYGPSFRISFAGETTSWAMKLQASDPRSRGERYVNASLRLSKIKATGATVGFNLVVHRKGQVVVRKNHTEVYPASDFLRRGIGYNRFCTYKELLEMFGKDQEVSEVAIIAELTITYLENVITGLDSYQLVAVNSRDLDEEFLSDLRNARQKVRFSDVTISCGGVDYPCHKVILATRSPVFDTMFNSDNQEGFQQEAGNRVTVEDAESCDVEVMLDYIYTGERPVDLDACSMGVLHLAEKYQLAFLKTMCETSLTNTLHINNALQTLAVLERYSEDSQGREDALRFCAANLHAISGTDSWTVCNDDPANKELIQKVVWLGTRGQQVEATTQSDEEEEYAE